VPQALDGFGQDCLFLTCSIDANYIIFCQSHRSAKARLAQSVESKAYNIAVHGGCFQAHG
jgi:hypothetical protein